MLIDVVRKIVPDGLRKRVGAWLFSNVVRSRLVIFAYSYFLYGVVVRLTPDGNCSVAFQGTEMTIPRDDSESVVIFVEVFRERIYEQFSTPKQGDIVIDVGAHVGTFAVKAAELVGDKGLVVAIEPEPRNLVFLERNIESHNLSNVNIVRKAILDKETTVRLYLRHLSGHHSVLYPSRNYIEVEADTLDNIVSQLGLDHVDFVKIDAEGVELEILRGAERTLASPGVKLCIAAYHVLPDGQPQLPSIISYLVSRQFQTQIYKKHNCPFIYATKQDDVAVIQQREAIR